MEKVAAEICELARGATLDLTLKVGQLVFERIFGGTSKAIRRHGRKNASFRRLARHPKLPFSATALWRAVAVYELLQRHSKFANDQRLGITHFRAVLGLPESTQHSLLTEAATLGWTTDRLERTASVQRTRLRGARGRRPIAAALRLIRRLERLANREPLDAQSVQMLNPADKQSARNALKLLVQFCDQFRAALEEDDA